MQWKLSRRMELYDMIDFLGIPTFFMTLSAADTHWPDLQLLLKRHEEGELPPGAEIDDAGRNGRVVRNPHMVGAFFVKRVKTFFCEVIGKEILVHYWLIFEWQMRGTIHCHCLLWLKDCPFDDVEYIVKHGTEEDKSELLKYYDEYISAWNPCSLTFDQLTHLKENDPTNQQLANPLIIAPQTDVHPCRIRCSEVEDVNLDLAALVNTVQRHGSCNTQTCLRKKRNSETYECKAGFPKELRPVSAFVEDKKMNGKCIFEPARNDPILNNYPKKGGSK